MGLVILVIAAILLAFTAIIYLQNTMAMLQSAKEHFTKKGLFRFCFLSLLSLMTMQHLLLDTTLISSLPPAVLRIRDFIPPPPEVLGTHRTLHNFLTNGEMMQVVNVVRARNMDCDIIEDWFRGTSAIHFQIQDMIRWCKEDNEDTERSFNGGITGKQAVSRLTMGVRLGILGDAVNSIIDGNHTFSVSTLERDSEQQGSTSSSFIVVKKMTNDTSDVAMPPFYFDSKTTVDQLRSEMRMVDGTPFNVHLFLVCTPPDTSTVGRGCDGG